MSLSNVDLLAIKAELTNDPLSLGLTTDSADDEANANKLNAISPTIQVKKEALSTADLFNAIAPIEHQALTDQQRGWLNSVLLLGQINPSTQGNILSGLNGLFAAETTSRPAITELISEDGSRVRQLFQAGTISYSGDLTPSDVANARNAV